MLALVVLLAAGGAAAETKASEPKTGAKSSAAQLASARRAFLEGRALLDRGEWAGAAVEFEKALAEKETAGLHYYVGYCHEQSGQLLRARAAYLAASELDRKAPAPDLAALLPEAIERVTSKIPRVEIRGVPADGEALWDGAHVEPTSLVEADPGEHVLVVRAPGRPSREITVRLEPGVTEVVRVEFPQEKAPAPASALVAAAPQQDAKARRSEATLRSIALWTSVGVLGAGLVTGGVGAVLHSVGTKSAADADGRIDEAEGSSTSACAEPSSAIQEDCDVLASWPDQRDTATSLMIGGLSAAAVGGVSALVTHFLWPDAPVEMTGTFDRSGGGVRLSGRF